MQLYSVYSYVSSAEDSKYVLVGVWCNNGSFFLRLIFSLICPLFTNNPKLEL